MKALRTSYLLLVVLGLFAASEVGLRMLTDRSSRWNLRLGANKQFDPVTFFRHKPNYHIGHGVHTNELGYLAPPNLERANPPHALRIIYLGDSNSVLPVRAAYPAQVERRLERTLGVEVQTVNTAVPGFASDNARQLFETEVSQFDADYFFVYLGWNDLGQYGPEGLPYKQRRAGYDVSPVRTLLAGIYTTRFLYAVQRHLRSRQAAVHEPLTPEDRELYERYRPDHFAENLGAILDLALSRYPHVYAMTLATITSDDPTERELRTAHFPVGMDKNLRKLHVLVETYDREVRRVARERGVPLIDLRRAFDSPERRAHFTDSCHMDAAGAGVVAGLVADEIARRERERAARAGAARHEAAGPAR